MSDIVTVSPVATVRSGPGEVTVDDVKPQPTGPTNPPNTVKEAGLALVWRRPGMKANPKIPEAIRRDRTNDLRSRSIVNIE